MLELDHFLGGNTVGIGLAEKRFSAVAAAAALAAGHIVILKYQ